MAKRCAKVINKDWDQDFSSCYTGKRGRRLLRESGECGAQHIGCMQCFQAHTADKLESLPLNDDLSLALAVLDAQRMNITKSCSIVINDRLVCVHDGSWKDCPNGHEAGDFARLIKEEYDAIN